MSIKEFIWKVVEMRDAQKHYFESRNPRVLKVACKLERLVDKQLDVFRTLFEDYSEDDFDIIIRLRLNKERFEELDDDV